jgi:hypothetical protein
MVVPHEMPIAPAKWAADPELLLGERSVRLCATPPRHARATTSRVRSFTPDSAGVRTTFGASARTRRHPKTSVSVVQRLPTRVSATPDIAMRLAHSRSPEVVRSGHREASALSSAHNHPSFCRSVPRNGDKDLVIWVLVLRHVAARRTHADRQLRGALSRSVPPRAIIRDVVTPAVGLCVGAA